MHTGTVWPSGGWAWEDCGGSTLPRRWGEGVTRLLEGLLWSPNEVSPAALRMSNEARERDGHAVRRIVAVASAPSASPHCTRCVVVALSDTSILA